MALLCSYAVLVLYNEHANHNSGSLYDRCNWGIMFCLLLYENRRDVHLLCGLFDEHPIFDRYKDKITVGKEAINGTVDSKLITILIYLLSNFHFYISFILFNMSASIYLHEHHNRGDNFYTTQSID